MFYLNVITLRREREKKTRIFLNNEILFMIITLVIINSRITVITKMAITEIEKKMNQYNF